MNNLKVACHAECSELAEILLIANERILTHVGSRCKRVQVVKHLPGQGPDDLGTPGDGGLDSIAGWLSPSIF